MQRKIRFFALLSALLLLLASFVSCSADESDEQLLAIAKELTEASAPINELLFGEGILPLENGYSHSAYTEADIAYLEKFGVSSVEDIKAKIKSVYASATASWIESTVLSSAKAEGQVLTYVRYYDGTKMEGSDSIPVLMVKDNYEPLIYGTVSYSNYQIKKSQKKEVIFTVDITVTDGEDVKNFPSSEIIMVKEDGLWRLDSTTYASIK